MKRLILFLIRLRLGLRKHEEFRFTNQKSDAIYYFDSEALWKKDHFYPFTKPRFSGVSLNWLLSKNCEITKEVYK